MKNKTKLKPLTINRKRWARGGFNGEAMLLNNQDSMCCLGFACKARGILEDDLLRCGSPEDLLAYSENDEKLFKKLGLMVTKTVEYDDEDYEDETAYADTDAVTDAIGINDDPKISDAMREYRLKPILRRLGFDVKFVGPTRDE